MNCTKLIHNSNKSKLGGSSMKKLETSHYYETLPDGRIAFFLKVNNQWQLTFNCDFDNCIYFKTLKEARAYVL